MSHQGLLDQMRDEDPELYGWKVTEGKIVAHRMVDPTFAGCWHAMLEVRKIQRRIP